ncbi:hypothetical protein B0E34_04765 [Chryseobacterium mucoviscidosis]|uniref:Uncharacterized protein n=1 Tax=Chryseobacterium mucoviscidosis TaxID=1945581 RepID=A0A202C830_9FLAO|nr:hypothetical protein B0E34_04765 [Chryseobacterium mucoviscidosis]
MGCKSATSGYLELIDNQMGSLKFTGLPNRILLSLKTSSVKLISFNIYIQIGEVFLLLQSA